jgi:hypothetical protein
MKITETMMQQWDSEIADGSFFRKGEWEEPVVLHRPVGRPRVFSEDLASVTFKAPHSEVRKLKRAAKKRGVSVSTLLRSLIETLPDTGTQSHQEA